MPMNWSSSVENASAHTSRKAPGQRWHLPALPTTLAKLVSISATTLARQFLPVLTTLLRS